MSEINGCNLPDDLYYLVEKHVWVRPDAEGVVVIGMSDVAQNLAGDVLSVMTKKVGRNVAKGKSVATMESAKWVGPVPAPVAGEILEVNQDLKATPALLNQDPYGSGWIVKLKPSDWDGEKGALATGSDGLQTYREFLNKEGIRCGEKA